MLTDSEIMERATQAEQARPYITSVVDQVKKIIHDHMIELAPTQTAVFSSYSSQLLCLNDFMATVEADIKAGENALNRIQGNAPDQKAGIL